MRFSALSAFAAGLLVLGGAEARLETIYVPAVIHATEGFTVILENHNYISSNQQFAIALGEKPTTLPVDQALGALLGSFYLGPEFSNTIGNKSIWVTGRSGTLPPGPVTLTFDVFSAYGAAYYPVIETFAVNVTYGSQNSYGQFVVAHRV